MGDELLAAAVQLKRIREETNNQTKHLNSKAKDVHDQILQQMLAKKQTMVRKGDLYFVVEQKVMPCAVDSSFITKFFLWFQKQHHPDRVASEEEANLFAAEFNQFREKFGERQPKLKIRTHKNIDDLVL